MPRMIELIRQSAVPANLMRAAAHGALSLPLAEMVEVLVYLTTQPLFSQQAQFTLTGWNESVLAPVLADPETPDEVLAYFLAPANLRSSLLPALLDNPAVTPGHLADLAVTLPASALPPFCAHPRICALEPVIRALFSRSDLPPELADQLRAALSRIAPPPDANEPLALDALLDRLDPDLIAYMEEHADEIAAASNQPFHLIGPSSEEQLELATVAHGTTGIAARALGGRERISAIQMICRLSVPERIMLAIKGNREERAILVRDGVRVVSEAVLKSPRVTEEEVDTYAALRNVAESVLRGIALSRRFMRRYNTKRVLTANPRCPIDVALPLIKELLVSDLDSLTKNRNISETVRRFAFRTLRAKQQNR